MEPICLTDLSYTVQGKTLLRGISLTMTARRVGVIGRNGSGKTTLLRLLAGLVAPTAGLVRLGDTDPFKDRKTALAKIGILFQNPDHQILFPTVLEELTFGLRQMGRSADEAKAAARALLQSEGRAHWEGAATHTLSQGQRQYLCLMAVLLMAPDTLLLDEPFAGLDMPTQARLSRKLNGLPQRIITINHDPATMVGVDQVLWLEAGQLRANGPAAQVVPLFSAEMARLGDVDADTDLAG